MIFIGPSPLSGIGQVVNKYASLYESRYYILGHDNIPSDENVIMFALPIPTWLNIIPRIKSISKTVTCMTICETETVHEDYGKLFKLFDRILTPSDYCKKIFERQFPDTSFEVFRCYTPLKVIKPLNIDFKIPRDKYIFYHIGNIVDYRKNIKQLIETFYRCGFGSDACLVLKATCNQTVNIKLPNVIVINGLIPEDELNQLHLQCNCYVSFSNSEGVGMGAVEAALQDKPVIITEYGGASEYVKTPYLVKCGLQELPNDDFLFKKGMLWGKPDSGQLMNYMKHAFDNKVSTADHTHTKELISTDVFYKNRHKLL